MIENQEEMKDLEITFDSKLTFNQHIDEVLPNQHE